MPYNGKSLHKGSRSDSSGLSHADVFYSVVNEMQGLPLMCIKVSLISDAHNETPTSAPAAGDVPARDEDLLKELHNVSDNVADGILVGGAADGLTV